MKRKILKIFVALIFSFGQAACAQEREVTVFVKDQDGQVVESAEVRGYIPHRGKGVVVKGLTDNEGKVQLTYSADSYIDYLKIEKGGYYETKYPARKEGKRKKNNAFPDQIIEAVLRVKKNPIPMFAYRHFSIKVPQYGKKLGFDFFEADWVVPYGSGTHADVVFKLDGYWNDYDDRDSTLTMQFPKKGDGYLRFNNDFYFSNLISPYEAPESAYLQDWRWRIARIKNPGFLKNGDTREILTVGEENQNTHMMFRIRTKLHEDGEVVEAYYGKIYRVIKFYGVSDSRKYNKISFTYYLNPNVNDRNLEYAPGQNLFKNIEFAKDPKEP